MATTSDCKALLSAVFPGSSNWKRTRKHKDSGGAWIRTFSNGDTEAFVREADDGTLSLVGSGAASKPASAGNWFFVVSDGAEPLAPFIEDGNPAFLVVLVSRAYWKAEMCLSDDHIADEIEADMGAAALSDMDEVQESTFTFLPKDLHMDLAGARAELLRRGFVEDKSFTKFIESFG